MLSTNVFDGLSDNHHVNTVTKRLAAAQMMSIAFIIEEVANIDHSSAAATAMCMSLAVAN
jgi:hypothetical protein